MTHTATPAPRRTGERGVGLVSAVLLPVAGLGVLLLAWWAVTELSAIPEVVLPPPASVWRAFAAEPAYLLDQTWVTGLTTLVGFLLSSVAGVLIGLMLAASRTVERMFSPLLVAFNAVPKIVLAPLLVAGLGFGQRPIQAMIFMICFFPVVLATATGLTTTPADLAELARSLDASRRQAFVKVRLPAALPQIFVGLKVAMPLAAIGAVIGEFQSGSGEGLGTVILNTSGIGDSATAFAAIVLIAVVSIALYYAVVLVERLLLPWVRETTSQR